MTALDPIEDKRQRYRIECDESQSILIRGKVIRLVAVLTKRDAPDETLQIILHNLYLVEPDWRYEGPPWKRHHADLYAAAVLAELREGGGSLPPLELPAVALTAPARAFPPAAPSCPSCGARMAYQCDYVGGRGSCWRHRCPGFAAGTCTHVEAWKS